MTDTTDYLSKLYVEVVKELKHRVEVGHYTTEEVFMPAGEGDLYESVEDFVSGRLDGSPTMDREESADNVRAFIFTKYWKAFAHDTSITINELDNPEAIEIELRAWFMQSFLWEAALLEAAESAGVSRRDALYSLL